MVKKSYNGSPIPSTRKIDKGVEEANERLRHSKGYTTTFVTVDEYDTIHPEALEMVASRHALEREEVAALMMKAFNSGMTSSVRANPFEETEPHH